MHEPDRPRGFEDRLLHEFRNYFDERNQTMNATEESPARTPRFGRATKFSFAGAVGAVALGIGAVVALPALTGSAAYAVEETKDGQIRIEVKSPEDAEGLEETLAEHGIKAKVDFPPEGMTCDPDRYRQPDEFSSGGSMETSVESGDDSVWLSFTVDPDEFPVDGDSTLVVEISESFFAEPGDEDVMTMFVLGHAKGAVGECDPRPIEDMPESSEGGDESGTADKKDDDGSKDKD